MLDDQLITMENQEFLGGIAGTIKEANKAIKEEKFQKAKKELEETIAGLELKLDQLNAQVKTIHESAKKKLESGDKEGAKKFLFKKKKINK